MKIGIVTLYAVNNIGDKILTDVVSWKLKANGHKIRIIDIQARYAYKFASIQFLKNIEHFLYTTIFHNDTYEKKYKYFYKYISECDIIVFGGGQIITINEYKIIRNIEIIIKICSFLHKNVYFNAIGISTWGNENCLNAIRNIFANQIVKEISVRDNINYFYEQIGVEKTEKIKQVCDTAVWCREAYNIPIIKRNVKKIGLNIIYADAFSLNYNVAKDEVIQKYSMIYEKLANEGFDVHLFTNGIPLDSKTVSEICRIIYIPIKNIKSYSYKQGKDFIKLLNEFDIIVSSRLHTSICAYSLKIPTVALSWDEKINSFYKQIDLEKCCYNMKTLEINQFIKQIKNLILNDYNEMIKNYSIYRSTIFNTDLYNL